MINIPQINRARNHVDNNFPYAVGKSLLYYSLTGKQYILGSNQAVKIHDEVSNFQNVEIALQFLFMEMRGNEAIIDRKKSIKPAEAIAGMDNGATPHQKFVSNTVKNTKTKYPGGSVLVRQYQQCPYLFGVSNSDIVWEPRPLSELVMLFNDEHHYSDQRIILPKFWVEVDEESSSTQTFHGVNAVNINGSVSGETVILSPVLNGHSITMPVAAYSSISKMYKYNDESIEDLTDMLIQNYCNQTIWITMESVEFGYHQPEILQPATQETLKSATKIVSGCIERVEYLDNETEKSLRNEIEFHIGVGGSSVNGIGTVI